MTQTLSLSSRDLWWKRSSKDGKISKGFLSKRLPKISKITWITKISSNDGARIKGHRLKISQPIILFWHNHNWTLLGGFLRQSKRGKSDIWLTGSIFITINLKPFTGTFRFREILQNSLGVLKIRTRNKLFLINLGVELKWSIWEPQQNFQILVFFR